MSTCPTCSGTGTVVEMHLFGDAYVGEHLTCPHCLGTRDDGKEGEVVTQPIDLIQMLDDREFACNDCGDEFHIQNVTRTMEGGNFYVQFACECGSFKGFVPRGTVQAGVQEVGKVLYREVERSKRPLGKNNPIDENIDKFLRRRPPSEPPTVPVEKMDNAAFARHMRCKRMPSDR